MNFYDKRCKICGKPIPMERSRQKYCSDECRAVMNRKRKLEYDREARAKAKAKKHAKSDHGLVEAALKAKLMGLSYGRYMALNYGKN